MAAQPSANTLIARLLVSFCCTLMQKRFAYHFSSLPFVPGKQNACEIGQKSPSRCVHTALCHKFGDISGSCLLEGRQSSSLEGVNLLDHVYCPAIEHPFSILKA